MKRVTFLQTAPLIVVKTWPIMTCCSYDKGGEQVQDISRYNLDQSGTTESVNTETGHSAHPVLADPFALTLY